VTRLSEDFLGALGGMETFRGCVRIRMIRGVRLSAVLLSLVGIHVPGAESQVREPVVYTIRVPSTAAQVAEIGMSIPTEGRASVDVMMPVWSPGYYRIENYAEQVQSLTAESAAGQSLSVDRVRPNRWRIDATGTAYIVVTYRILCARSFVTGNWVSADLGVLTGPSTFLAVLGDMDRPHEVRVEPPPSWPRIATGLTPAPDGQPHHYRADDYDTLVDAPIVAGDLEIHEFVVDGVPHLLVDVGERGSWDGKRVTRHLRRIVQQTLTLWGTLPYERYVFLNVFRPGGGGLEHGNSTLLTTNARRVSTEAGYDSWLSFAAHEYFHAFNVKRLRPIELGPFDYEEPPRTPSLWLSEGITSYYGDLFLARAGLTDTEALLGSLSSTIRQLQTSPGRLLQTLEESSLNVWTNSNSGVAPAASTVSYYVKGQVVGFLLDAEIRRRTEGRRSLDDVMRAAYRRHGGARGFTPEEFVAITEEAAAAELGAWFQKALSSTEELDYDGALDWYGLRFKPDERWTLELNENATPSQIAHWRDLVAPAGREATSIRGEEPPSHGIWVETLGLDAMFQRWGRPVAGGIPSRGRSTRPITLGGVVYPHGIGTNSISEFVLDLKGQAQRFVSMIGLDDSATSAQASVNFAVWGDDDLLFATDTIRPGDPPRLVAVDLSGVRVLTLLLDDAQDTSNGDTGVWAGAAVIMREDATESPEPYDLPVDPAPDIAPGHHPEPRIHGPLIVGTTPGRPFHHLVPATGEGPLEFSAQNLPDGLTIDPRTGIITGTLEAPGRTVVRLTVSGPAGNAVRELTVVGGDDALALTPPMGWNSWNAWGPTVDDAKVRAAADSMVESGLAAHGYQYIVIDDGWQGERDEDGVLHPNSKFPDMKALGDYLHARGLKFGIYSSPGPTTCQGLPGSYQHEKIDAETWAAWGVDFLKHDYRGYSRIAADRSVAEMRKPYDLMGEVLTRIDRDIVYGIGNYGWGDVWEWRESTGGHLWRTTGDLENSWANLESVGFRQAGREPYAGPGHWNDTDMLIVGTLSWGRGEPRPTKLTRNEQILHITLWAIQAAPLMVGADLTKLDPWTIDLLTNDEVLAVTMDTLGIAGGPVWKEGRLEVWARPLHDGTRAVGLFNRGLVPYDVTVRFSDVGRTGSQPVRDLWRKENLGAFVDDYTATVPRHGAVMLRIGDPEGS
jgi:alpha-galactosidase